MMATVAVLVIMAGCAALQFLKGNLIKSFAALMSALCAGIVAFAWFEQLANLLFIGKETMPDWAQLICFALLFILSFAILLTVATTFLKHPVDFGVYQERIGRVVFGLALGLVLSGVILTAFAMAPIDNKYPYPRFETGRPNLQNRSKAILNPDGFITGLFGIISSGSLSGANSFAVVHADFLDQLFFSRYQAGRSISILAEPGSIKLPDKAAAWPAPQGLKNTDGEPVSSNDLIILRVGLTNALVRTAPGFTAGQLRLIYKEKDDKGPFKSAYPIGYLKTPDQLQKTSLAEQIRVESSEIRDGAKWTDFAFRIPSGSVPVAISFKANIVLEVPPMVSAEQAPK